MEFERVSFFGRTKRIPVQHQTRIISFDGIARKVQVLRVHQQEALNGIGALLLTFSSFSPSTTSRC